MNDIDLDRLMAKLAKDIAESGITEEDSKIPQDFGNLGYNKGNGYSVVDLDNPENFLVSLKSGTFRSIPHNGAVFPIPGLPVVIRFKNDDPVTDRTGYIFGIDRTEYKNFLGDAAAFMNQVGFHSHHRGSGMEFPIDLRMIDQLSARYAGDLNIEIRPGWFFWEGQHYYYPGTTLDYSSLKPTTVSYQKWVVTGLKRDDKTIVRVSGTEYPSITPAPESDIENITFDDPAVVPLFASKVYQNRSRFTEFDIIALYCIVGGGGGSTFDVDTILTSEGHVLVSDGNVLTTVI